MLLLAAYAAISWYAIYRFRRRWAGGGMLLLSLAGVALLSYLDIMLHRLVVGGNPGLIFQFILASEALIILFVGTVLLMVPRDRAQMPCRGCGYELRGLDELNPRCPECGMEHAARRPRAGRCVQCHVALDEAARAVSGGDGQGARGAARGEAGARCRRCAMTGDVAETDAAGGESDGPVVAGGPAESGAPRERLSAVAMLATSR